MNKILIVVLALVSGAMFCSCVDHAESHDSWESNGSDWETKEFRKEQMTVSEFTDWFALKQNSLSKVRVISEMKYSLSYLPAEVMAYLELRNEDFDFERFKKVQTGYSEMTYFNLKLEVLDGRGELLKYKLDSPAQYEDRIKYFSFKIEKDIYLIQGNDTIWPGLCQFERIFEVAPHVNVMFAFDNRVFDRNREFTIVYNDKVFEKGTIKYYYQNNQLINLPNITAL